ncbi:MAG: YciI family protein [Gemmatimonadetes bacterium]|nr:YciI family protein [Gemmatimonadota bacterium]
MHYSILIYQSRADFDARTDPAKREVFLDAFVPYVRALREAGIVVASAGLESPESATTLRVGEGGRTVQDGPYADTKEQLGGFFVIDVPDLDAALQWAARCPIGEGMVVEVRGNLPHMS